MMMIMMICMTYFSANDKLKWCELTISQRTVIASVLYQYGSPEKVPKFWKYATEQVQFTLQIFKCNFNDIRNYQPKCIQIKVFP